jgi:transformation/transcription domain-associated protein
VQSSLREWQSLPPFVGNGHLELLQRFQRLVELMESAQMLSDIHSRNQITHFKSFITTWRERLCNKWEELPVWNDVLTWRNHVTLTQLFCARCSVSSC